MVRVKQSESNGPHLMARAARALGKSRRTVHVAQAVPQCQTPGPARESRHKTLSRALLYSPTSTPLGRLVSFLLDFIIVLQ